MVIASSIIAQNAAAYLVDFVRSYAQSEAGAKIKEMFASNYTEYEKELADIINKAMARYQEDNPNNDLDNVYFYQSQTIFNELMKFRLTGKIQSKELINAIEKDDRLTTPTIEEVNKFINYFNEEVRTNSKISKLFVDDYYKQEIFNLSKNLNELSIEISNSMDK